jgi:hypothetical protein
MLSQSYANHTHVPKLTMLAWLFVLIGSAGFVLGRRAIGGGWTFALGLGGLTAAVIVLIWISRRYTTRLQDRIIRLEMRVRCAAFLTPAELRTLQSLDLRRIAALRFASDEELPALLDRAVLESLAPDEIKRAVKTWVPDVDRT